MIAFATKNRIIILLFLAISFIGVDGFSQTTAQKLKAKEALLKKQLAETQELLSATRKSQNSTLSELRIINKQISYKEELLINLQNQVSSINNQIKANRKEVASLTESMVRLRKEFKEMVRFAYKNRKKENNVMYLFASEDINQAYRRMKYIEQYSENRKLKVVEIKNTQEKLKDENLKLLANIESKKATMLDFEEEKSQFLAVKKNQQLLLNEILSNKEALQTKLHAQEKERKKIAAAIKREIEKELAKSKSNNSFKLSPEAKLASSSFERNKGKLPWPVERGTITKRFGKQRHSQVSSAYIQNNGIDISTTKGSAVRAVFEGTVTAISPIPGAGQMIIISHGAYRTVYSNLKIVNVSLNQKVKTKQNLGILLPNETGAISESHFEIWKIIGSDITPQNPSAWLYRN